MSEHADVIAEVMESSKGRMIGDGLEAADIDEILARCTGWGDWYEVVTSIGDRYEAMAERALAGGSSITAGVCLWRASMYYHYAQFYMFERPDLREAGQKRKVALYNRAAPLFFPPAERIDVPFEGFTIPGFLRKPAGVDRPRCAVLIGGLESTKEESYLFERMCHDRGMATFAFDGPGQGEMYFQTPIRPDFERFTSAVLDALEARGDIDPSTLRHNRAKLRRLLRAQERRARPPHRRLRLLGRACTSSRPTGGTCTTSRATASPTAPARPTRRRGRSGSNSSTSVTARRRSSARYTCSTG